MNPTADNGHRANNYNFVRIVAALFVMAGHMGPILGIAAPTVAGHALHTIGVTVLFLIGGCLITDSWLRDPHPARYLLRRFLRLWPPYAAMILLMAFLAGPLLSALGAGGYFASWWRTYLQNLRFYIIYAQPGVFENLPIPNVTNGSLWTMPVEAALYILLPLVLLALQAKSRRKGSFIASCIFTALVCAVDLWCHAHPDVHLIWYATDWVAALHLISFFCIGMLYSYPQMKKLLNLQLACGGLFILLIAEFAPAVLRQLCLMVALPYFVFSLAWTPKPVFSAVGQKAELSYGIYLYGFFCQQLIVWVKQTNGYGWGYVTCLVLSLIPTLLCAYISSKVVEQPTQRLCRYLCKRIGRREAP